MTYDYECPEGHVTEKFRMPAEIEEIECPRCGKPAKKAFSAKHSIQWSWRPDQVRDMGKRQGLIK